ncbi:hypothetical protein I7I51_08864 [Histoplasma capsulatum]|uniref:Uncharacterized protein n=1 Tax=Ajellomyces capsulatus TaxID=5037 RepID=A0A8A1M003_AJECA|nr:hypothetical protein I7I51_08864 [Histoplasma capsulatum]
MILPTTLCLPPSITSLQDHRLKFVCHSAPTLSDVSHQHPELEHKRYQYHHPACDLQKALSMDPHIRMTRRLPQVHLELLPATLKIPPLLQMSRLCLRETPQGLLRRRPSGIPHAPGSSKRRQHSH